MEPIELDRMDSTPLYRQLARVLRDRIGSGAFQPGDRLPTEQALSRELDLSLSTVRGAYAELVEEGLVVRRAGRGSFVAEPRINRSLGGIYNFTTEMEQLGKTPGTRVLSFERREASDEEADALETAPGAEVFELVRLRLADGEPLLLERSCVPVAICPELEEADVEGSLYEALGRLAGVNPGSAHEVHEVVLLGVEEAELLGRTPGAPAFLVTRITRTDMGVPFEYSTAFAPGDATRYVMDLAPGSVSVAKAHDLA